MSRVISGAVSGSFCHLTGDIFLARRFEFRAIDPGLHGPNLV
jgi:hypothetical protein